jgi:hypothetical protein
MDKAVHFSPESIMEALQEFYKDLLDGPQNEFKKKIK